MRINLGFVKLDIDVADSKVELIDNWKQAWRLWSIRLGVLGSALTTFFITFPNQAVELWETLPEGIKSIIPEDYLPMIGVSITVLSLISRVIKQPSLMHHQQRHEPPEEEHSPE